MHAAQSTKGKGQCGAALIILVPVNEHRTHLVQVLASRSHVLCHVSTTRVTTRVSVQPYDLRLDAILSRHEHRTRLVQPGVVLLRVSRLPTILAS